MAFQATVQEINQLIALHNTYKGGGFYDLGRSERFPHDPDARPGTDGPFFRFQEFGIAEDPEGNGRFVSLAYGRWVGVASPGTNASDLLAWNSLTWQGEETPPEFMIGAEYLAAQERVTFRPLTCLSYEPIPRVGE